MLICETLPRENERLVWVSLPATSGTTPSASPSLGTAISQVDWSEGMLDIVFARAAELQPNAGRTMSCNEGLSQSKRIAACGRTLIMLAITRGFTLARGTLSSISARAMSTAPLLVSPAELRSLGESKVRVLDASWHMPGSPRKGNDEFINKRIPGAQFLDLDVVASEHELGLKHMMPSGSVFADACGMCLGKSRVEQ